MNALNELDLEPIKVKLMHQESGEGWSLERANAVELEYRRFLLLMKKYPHEATSPLVDVDTFWHYHILDTLKYAADCNAVFGYFLHHFPYIGMRGEEDAATLARIGQRMQQLYEAEFGEAYVRTERLNYGAASVNPAYCGSPAPAYCGSPSGQVAYCGSPSQQAAYCGAPTGKQAAYCGAPGVQAAYCGAPSRLVGSSANLYSERPRLN